MNVTITYPYDQEALLELQKKASAIHADAVLQYIQKLSCPKEQKLELYNKLIISAKHPEGLQNQENPQ